MKMKDKDGNEWSSFTNQWQQKMWRCVAGLRKGDEIHDGYLMLPPDNKTSDEDWRAELLRKHFAAKKRGNRKSYIAEGADTWMADD